MSDRHSPAQRSYNMSRIRSSRNASTELRFVTQLREQGVTGWRRKFPLFGSPDFTFPRQRVAVFLDGCFWHGCTKCAQMPSTNQSYWRGKFERNRKRDKQVTKRLRDQGWRVLRFWEHALDSPSCIGRLVTLLHGRLADE